MKLKVKIPLLILLIASVALLSVSIAAIISGRATLQYHPPLESIVELYKYLTGGYWEEVEFQAAWPMLVTGVVLLIGASMGIYSDTKRKR